MIHVILLVPKVSDFAFCKDKSENFYEFIGDTNLLDNQYNYNNLSKLKQPTT